GFEPFPALRCFEIGANRPIKAYAFAFHRKSLFLLSRELQSGPVRVDSANFVVDKLHGEARPADVILIEVDFVTAGLLGMNDPKRAALREARTRVRDVAVEFLAGPDEPNCEIR